VSVAPQTISVDIDSDGTMRAETEIFHGVFPTVGVHLSGSLKSSKPIFITADEDRWPMRSIRDGEGRSWWVDAGPWDPNKKRHLSELHRTLGQFEVDIGGKRLLLNNVATGFGRAELEDFLRDFRDDLYWLLLGFGAGKATVGGRATAEDDATSRDRDASALPGDNEITAALLAFSAATERVLSRPAHATREITALQPLAKLRPNAATYRYYARNPSATRLPGRQADLSMDISENRYLRHMVQTAFRISDRLSSATERQASILSARAEIETARNKEYLSTRVRIVDPKIYDRQIAEIEEVLERIRACSGGDVTDLEQPVQRFSLRIGDAFSGGTEGKYFCRRSKAEEDEDVREGFSCRVVKLSPSLERAMIAARPLDPFYEIDAVASVERSGRHGQVRLLKLHHLVSISPKTDALERRLRKRQRLEANNWEAPLSSSERGDLQREARTAALRAKVYAERAASGSSIARALVSSRDRLRRQERRLDNMGVKADSQFPYSMLFSQSPDYVACLSTFRKLSLLIRGVGFGADALEALDQIGIIHASALYEHWCLVKILLVLIEDYRFAPQTGWQETLIRGLTGNRETVSMVLEHDELDLEAQLDIQPILPNGRQPDFRLRFRSRAGHTDSSPTTKKIFPSDAIDSEYLQKSALVLDAKFRNSWKPGELRDVLATLVETKRYGGLHDRVFILQPAGNQILEPSSPLAWGIECDYGHEADLSHKQGHIRLAPGESANRSSVHLKRLIALHLQSSFPSPSPSSEKQRSVFSFCIGCGTKHIPETTRWRTTDKGKTFWLMSCSECQMVTTRTHCYGCDESLFKNGYELTYHQTLADQITNVRCPACGRFFDNMPNPGDGTVRSGETSTTASPPQFSMLRKVSPPISAVRRSDVVDPEN
jgi:hypothetical protein